MSARRDRPTSARASASKKARVGDATPKAMEDEASSWSVEDVWEIRVEEGTKTRFVYVHPLTVADTKAYNSPFYVAAYNAFRDYHIDEEDNSVTFEFRSTKDAEGWLEKVKKEGMSATKRVAIYKSSFDAPCTAISSTTLQNDGTTYSVECGKLRIRVIDALNPMCAPTFKLEAGFEEIRGPNLRAMADTFNKAVRVYEHANGPEGIKMRGESDKFMAAQKSKLDALLK